MRTVEEAMLESSKLEQGPGKVVRSVPCGRLQGTLASES